MKISAALVVMTGSPNENKTRSFTTKDPENATMNRKKRDMREKIEKYTPHPIVFQRQIALTLPEREGRNGRMDRCFRRFRRCKARAGRALRCGTRLPGAFPAASC
ncbi:protein of unknown function [Shinella sp. WSC3-e]|nr:hypothetical protein SHINE37_42232 [Rhizobiaceae bacterium]CAK7256824.1 protein of unknown function [Shinella sp. WSC3-e]